MDSAFGIFQRDISTGSEIFRVRDISTVFFARANGCAKTDKKNTLVRANSEGIICNGCYITALVSFHFDPSIARTDGRVRDPRRAIRDVRSVPCTWCRRAHSSIRSRRDETAARDEYAHVNGVTVTRTRNRSRLRHHVPSSRGLAAKSLWRTKPLKKCDVLVRARGTYDGVVFGDCARPTRATVQC